MKRLKEIEVKCSNDILNFAAENEDEQKVLQELVSRLKTELKAELISDIQHKLR